MKYTCELCKKEFNKKSNYEYHIGRKRPCINNNHIVDDKRLEDNQILIVSNVSNDVSNVSNDVSNVSNDVSNDVSNVSKQKEIFKCKDCHKTYHTSQALSKHKKKHLNIDYIDFCRDMIKTMKKKLGEDVFKSLSLEDSNNDKIIEDTEVIQTRKVKTKSKKVETNNNIQLAEFGFESIYDLDDEEIKNLIKINDDPVKELIKYFHFNDKYPQYQNIRVSNMRSSHVQVYDGNKWISMKNNDFTFDIYDCCISNITDLNNYINKNNKKKNNHFTNAIDKFKNRKDNENDTKEYLKSLLRYTYDLYKEFKK